MYNVICVTNRKLCEDDFITRLERLKGEAQYFILREKDLSAEEYKQLALRAKEVLKDKLILHSYFEVCKELNINRLHLPLYRLEQNPEIKKHIDMLGVSIHSPDEALKAQNLGADYIIAGHIFGTKCKPDLPPRGLDFLKAVCGKVKIPVYGIGGITPENIAEVINCGAYGGCMMNYFMKKCLK